MRVCKKCGSTVSETEIYCPNCGAKLDPYIPEPEEKPKKEEEEQFYYPEDVNYINSAWIGSFLALWLGLVGLIICLFFGNKKCRKSAIWSYLIYLNNERYFYE